MLDQLLDPLPTDPSWLDFTGCVPPPEEPRRPEPEGGFPLAEELVEIAAEWVGVE